MKFNIGDRIKCTESHMNNQNVVGKTGTIKNIDHSYWVEFDEDIDGHDACGKYGHCWCFVTNKPELYFELINSNLVELI